jgi:hypothetical protein
MKRDIERRIDALESTNDSGRVGPLIWIEPGQPVPSPDERPGAVYFTWQTAQEVVHVETV